MWSHKQGTADINNNHKLDPYSCAEHGSQCFTLIGLTQRNGVKQLPVLVPVYRQGADAQRFYFSLSLIWAVQTVCRS